MLHETTVQKQANEVIFEEKRPKCGLASYQQATIKLQTSLYQIDTYSTDQI